MQAVSDIKRTTNNEKVHFYPLDLLDLKSVRKFAKDIGGDFEKIDILINNAGMADGRKDKVRLQIISTLQQNNEEIWLWF